MKSFKEFIRNSKTKKKYPGPEKRVGPRRNTSSDNINWGGRRISDTVKESLILEENYDPDHPKNMRIVKMHKDDTNTGKHRWDIRADKGEGDIVDSYGSRIDAHHYLTKFRKEKTNTVKESSENIKISDDKSIVTISVDGKDRFMLRPAEGHKPKSYGGGTYKYWTIYDTERKKDRINSAKGMMSKNEAIAYVKKLVRLENKSQQAVNEDLRNWFNPNHPDGNWKRVNTKGEVVGDCAREPGEPKPKCMSQSQRDSLSKKEKANAVRRKRKADPNPERQGAPINVKSKVNENIEQLDEKNVPTNPELWSRAIAQAKSKFDVYPSAYANGWASKWYKGKGGGWKSVSEETERLSFKDFIAERCWPRYKEVKGKKAYAPGSCVKESAAAIAAATAIAKKKSGNYDSEGFRKTPYKNPDSPNIKTNAERKKEMEESAAWQRKEGKNPEGGLNRKGIESYRRENPGSKLSMAVTTPPSELKPGSKAANRRKSFCARMGGMEGPMKKPNGEPTRKALSLRKWNC